MHYHDSRQIQGSAQVALRTIRDSLVANGFKITAVRDDSFEATGPGMHSSRQDPLRGFSRATVSARGSTLETHAELGGVSRLAWLFVLVPLGFVVLFVVLALVKPASAHWTAPLLALLPWLIAGPAILRLARRRAVHAMQTLIESAAKIAAAG